jgi:hypothetical protein
MDSPQAAISFGGWIENNIGVLLAVLVQVVALIVWLVRLEGRVKFMLDRIESIESHQEELSKDMRQHTTDQDRHVNRQDRLPDG